MGYHFASYTVRPCCHFVIHSHNDSRSYVRSERTTTAPVNLSPFHELMAHQGGVNSMATAEGRGEANQYILVSGGDDQALCMYRFDLLHEAEAPTALNVLGHWKEPLAHASSIQGRTCCVLVLWHSQTFYTTEVKLAGGYVFSTSPDQRYSTSSSIFTPTRPQVEYLASVRGRQGDALVPIRCSVYC